METKTKQILEAALNEIEKATNKQDLFAINTKYLGKTGEISALMRELKNVPVEEKPKIGAILNECRQKIDAQLREKAQNFDEMELQNKLMNEKIDVTIPVKPENMGTMHPISLTQKELMDFFVKRGFTVRVGTDVETDYYCFEALNVPKDHPARDMQDTFYINDEIVLRTHTSATQIHTMEKYKPPIKMVSTGQAYRVDEIDATHSPFFHQLEILVVDENVSMADLKGTVEEFVKYLLGEKTKVRLRPSYFPFTEPSVEADATCPKCGGKGCPLCKNCGWIEVLGCGMVNPKILEEHNIDTNKYAGYAIGVGIERLAMIKYGINDMRQLYENDVNLLKQLK